MSQGRDFSGDGHKPRNGVIKSLKSELDYAKMTEEELDRRENLCLYGLDRIEAQVQFIEAQYVLSHNSNKLTETNIKNSRAKIKILCYFW